MCPYFGMLAHSIFDICHRYLRSFFPLRFCMQLEAITNIKKIKGLITGTPYFDTLTPTFDTLTPLSYLA